jgi:hypothetical protein
MKIMRRALAVALLAGGCATPDDPYRLDQPRSGAGVEIAPYAVREECFTLNADDRIDFYFTSTAALSFNIHYHDGTAVVEPLAREHTTAEASDFVADRRQVYCMMWEAGAEPALIDYRVRRMPRKP